VSQKTSDFLIRIFTDGASTGNPGPGGWGAIVVTSDEFVVELGGFDAQTTNNRMEILAAIRGLETVSDHPSEVIIFTDSTYLIRGITQWIFGWMKRSWVSSEGKAVANVDLWKKLYELTRNKNIQWKYVRGHAGIPGNERADQIAVAFSQRRGISLFKGPLSQYSVPIHEIPNNTELPDLKKPQTKEKPTSYLSLVGNIPMRHSNWSECERRVKGQSGAKFKKAMNLIDEEQILQSWGYKTTDLKE
jgi:ribonuclease HI